MRRLAGKKLIIFAVGLNVMQAETRKQLRDINFSKRKVRGLTCYYCPGLMILTAFTEPTPC